MKKLFVAAAALLSFSLANAQVAFNLGYFNVNSETTTSVGNLSTTEKESNNSFNFLFTDNINLVSDLNVNVGGGFYFGFDKDDDVKYKDFGLIIPFEFNYSFALGSDFKLSPYAGPIFDLGLVSKSKSDDEELNWFDNDLVNYKRLGIYLGVGAMLDFQDMLRLKVGYNFGLLDGIKECKVPATDMEAKYKGLVVSVGYLF